MQVLRKGLLADLDVSIYAKPELSHNQMSIIYDKLIEVKKILKTI